MKESTKTALKIGGVATALYLGFRWVSRSTGITRQPQVYLPGDTARVYQGQSMLVQLPIGDYTMVGGEGLVMLSQKIDPSRGVTYVALLVGVGNQSLDPVFIDKENPQKQHSLTIVTYPVPKPESVGPAQPSA